MLTSIRVGARGSQLSLWQAHHVVSLLRTAWPELGIEIEIISTRGDRVLDTPLPLLGGKGVFTEEIEAALHSGRIDLAIHSLKDLPVEQPAALTLGAIPERGAVADVLISRSGKTLAELPAGAVIGTSSPRRGAQLLAYRSDLEFRSIRGNIDTRIAKALNPAGEFDAILLAQSGIERLEMAGQITESLSLDLMLPAPGQGALAVQCRANDPVLELLVPINHAPTEFATIAERAVLQGLGGGCSAPIGAYAWFDGATMQLQGRWVATDGSRSVTLSSATAGCESAEQARAVGIALAHEMRAAGARMEQDVAV